MGDMLLNGRKPQDWEYAAIGRARERERDRTLEMLAGVMTDEDMPRPVPADRTVSDMLLALP